MSRPLVVSIPHRLGKDEALRRLKNEPGQRQCELWSCVQSRGANLDRTSPAVSDQRAHSRFAHLRRRDRRAADRSDRSRLDAAQHHRFGEPLADISCTFGILVLRIADERADLPILTRMTNLKPSIPDRPALRKKGPFRNPLAVNESCAFKPAEHDPLEAAACVGSNGAAARSTPPNGNPHSRGSP